MGLMAAVGLAMLLLNDTPFLQKYAAFVNVNTPTNYMKRFNYIPKRDRRTEDFSVRAFSPLKPGV